MTFNKLNFKLVNILIVALIFYIAVVTKQYWAGLIKTIFTVILPFIISFAIAYALYPFVQFLERKGVRKWLAVTIVVLFIVLLLTAIIAITLPLLYDQLVLFSKMMIEVIGDISSKFDLNLGEIQGDVTDTLSELIKKVGTFISDGTISFLGKSINFLSQGIIIFVVSVYFLFGMEDIRRAIRNFLKKTHQRLYFYIKVLDREMEQYFHGLFLFMFVQLIEYSLVFRLIGHPNWVILGILASVTTVIPYFGGFITNLIAVITASVVSTPLFIATIIVCLIFPQIDSYFISPKIYGKTNNINPIWTIFAVFAGGVLGGFMGIVISLPVYIFINRTIHFFQYDIKKQVDKVVK